MPKKDLRLIGVAITIGILAIGAYFYMNSEEEFVANPPVIKRESKPAPSTSPVPEVIEPEATTEITQETPPAISEAPINPLDVDPVLKKEEENLEKFKNLLRLEVDLPMGMHFNELDLEGGVAAIEGGASGRKIVIMGATRTATPELIASFLREQKASIPMLTKYDFKISGSLKNVPPPKDSGISKITVIPGGQNQGNAVFAAYLERGDKKGSYVFVMEAHPSQFDQFEDQFDHMLESIKAKP